MKIIKKSIRLFLKGLLILFITICLFEVIYRYQWFDSYKTEWNYFNKNLDSTKSKVLVFGDSFTANQNSWVTKWNTTDSTTTIYNAAVPGISVETYRLIQKGRMAEVNPTKVIVQLYIGNDLLDIKKPLNWTEFSINRNLFWGISNQFRSLNYLNYRMGQINQDIVSQVDPKANQKFSPSLYSPRTKLFITGDNKYPGNSINIEGSRKNEFKQLVGYLDEMKNNTPKNCDFYVLIVPHCTQVSQFYRDCYNKIGGNATLQKENEWNNRLAESGFSCINPLPYFQQKESDSMHLYFENDPHLNDYGQEKLSEYILKYFSDDLEKN